jgi:tetratricopeptide (TPR) repeat protein
VTCRLALAAVGVACALAIACGKGGGATVGGAKAPPNDSEVALPDISRASPEVQAQLRKQHASMTAVVSQPTTPAADRAAAYGDMGKLFVATELYEAADRCFAKARQLAPNDMRWPYYQAHVARLSNDSGKAATLFEHTLTLQADHVPSLVWLAEMRLAQNRPSDAKTPLLKARSLAPREAGVLYGLGRVALEERDYEAAVKQLEAALALAPSATRVQYPLAMAYRGLGNAEQAEAHLRLRGEVALPPSDPLMSEVRGLLNNAAALETAGVQAMEARDWPKAIAVLRQAVAAAPDNGFTRLNLGTSLYLSGDGAAALEEYRAAVKLVPSLARAHFAIGIVLEGRRRDREAIEAFRAAVDSDPAFAEAHFSLANALRRTGRVAESLTHYDAVLARNPSASQASFGAAMALVRLGRFREARDRLERDAQAFSDQPGFQHALARVLAAAPDDSVRDGARAVALARPLAEKQRSQAVVETMAMALAETGRFDEAVQWQSEAIDLARRGGRADLVAHLTANLRSYQMRRPCRTPWTNDDPVHHPQPTT